MFSVGAVPPEVFKTHWNSDLLTHTNWQGEDGEPGYPGPQGPPGAKVKSLILFVLFFMHLHSWMFYCVLKQGEPGIGEKGERGMDGLPGEKVEDVEHKFMYQLLVLVITKFSIKLSVAWLSL